MTKRLVAALAVIAHFALAQSAAAQNAAAPDVTTRALAVLHLSETAQRDVPRDLLHATLAAEATDTDAAKVQAEINRRMTAALARVKQSPEIAVETQGYSVYQDNPDKAPARWHGSQSLTLTGKDFAAVLALVGALQQQGLVTQGLAPDISVEARRSVEDALTDEALARLKQRGDKVAATLGVKLGGFRDIRVGNAAPPPVRPLLMRAAAASASPAPLPVAEPGSATVSVTVEAEIALAPR